MTDPTPMPDPERPAEPDEEPTMPPIPDPERPILPDEPPTEIIPDPERPVLPDLDEV